MLSVRTYHVGGPAITTEWRAYRRSNLWKTTERVTGKVEIKCHGD